MTLTAQAHRPTTASLPPMSPFNRRPLPGAAADVDVTGRALTYLVWSVLVLSIVGAVIAARQLTAAPTTGSSSAQAVLRTPYGLAAVGDVTVSAKVDASKGMVGKGHAAHTGAVSGAAGVRVNVPVTLHNDSDVAVRYAPEQFRLVPRNGQPAGPEDSALLAGQLRPGAAIALRLTFALPGGATGAHLTVDGGQPAAGLDLRLPPASTPGQQMTPQDHPGQPGQPAQPADSDGPTKHAPSDNHRH